MARLKVEGMAALLGEVQSNAEIPESVGQKVVAIDRLVPFANHPFKPYTEHKMAEMVESIREHGIVEPLIVRPAKGALGYFEIIAGHNRLEGAKRVGLASVPVFERDLDDETATIMMVNSNFVQREKIMPSEKALAYKMKLEAIRRQGQRNDLTSTQVAAKSRSDDEIGGLSGDSGDTVRRYIRLTELIPELLERVDSGKLKFTPAVEISYLSETEQKGLVEILCAGTRSVSLKQATQLREQSKKSELDGDKIEEILAAPNKKEPDAIKLPFKKMHQFFQSGVSSAEVEEVIMMALERYFAEKK